MTKTLTDIKREAREELVKQFLHDFKKKGIHPERGPEASLTFLDTFADRLLEEVERAVVPEAKANKDWTQDEHGKKCVDGCTYCSHASGMSYGHNSCRQKVLEALAKFKGV